MSFVKNLQKNMKAHHFIAMIGILVLVLAIMQYTGRKNTFNDGFGGNTRPNSHPVSSQNTNSVAVAAEPLGNNEVYANVPSGSTTNTHGLSQVAQPNTHNPSDLLPKDMNSQWAQLNPAGSADFKNVNLLQAGYLIGKDTIGSSLKNANLQLRSEDANPTTAVSPWGNTTIEPDTMRRPLEIGTGN
jgi:hypothetical protein